MMKRSFVCLLFCTAILAAQTGNLLNNADFSNLHDTLPLDWKTNITANGPDSVMLLPGDGVNGENALRLNLEKMVSFGQGGIRLVPGEKYKVGAYVRTRSFRNSRGGICIANYGWLEEVGCHKLPENTNGKWEKLECDVVCLAPGKNSFSYGAMIYSFQIFAVNAEGTIDVSAPYLIPMTEKAAQNSVRARRFEDMREIIPLSPLLDEVPSENAEFEFYCPHYADADMSASIIRASSTIRSKLKNHRARIVFPKIMEGLHCLNVSLTIPGGEQPPVVSDYLVRVVSPRIVTPAKTLNNLTDELCNKPMKNGSFEFVLDDGKWLFVSLDSGNAMLDGKVLSFESRNEKREAMLRMNSGKHVLNLSGAEDGSLIVRTIPEILVYPFKPSQKPDYPNGEYDYAFLKKYLSPAVNTYCFENTWNANDSESAMAIDELLKSGRSLIGCGGFHANKWYDAVAMRRNLECYSYIYMYGGRAIDELSGGSHFSQLDAYTETLWMSRCFPYPVYTWLHGGGMMCDPHYHLNLIVAQSNASCGRGKFLCEAYIRTRANLTDQQEELDQYRKIVEEIKQFYPAYTRRLLMISGGYQLPGNYLKAIYPQSDPKYAQDLFFQMCATDPVFEGLYGIGIYSYLSSDEENVRWYGALFRHYGIEGEKNLLSDRYGFEFIPGHLHNCDFESGLEGWGVQGLVEATSIKDYGTYQGRSWKWQSGSISDTVAVLEARNGESTLLSQTAKKFVPGKCYSITYISADRTEVEKKMLKPAFDHLLELRLNGAEILERQMPRQRAAGKAFTPHKVIFKALKPEIEVSFLALPPETGSRQVLLNYIALRPYFQD